MLYDIKTGALVSTNCHIEAQEILRMWYEKNNKHLPLAHVWQEVPRDEAVYVVVAERLRGIPADELANKFPSGTVLVGGVYAVATSETMEAAYPRRVLVSPC